MFLFSEQQHYTLYIDTIDSNQKKDKREINARVN